jgi:hypothetical protein
MMAVMCLLPFGAVAGCVKPANAEKVKIRFDYQDAMIETDSALNDIQTEEAVKGAAVVLPSPEIAPYRFGGWFYAPGGAGGRVEDGTPAEEGLTFYAYWLGTEGLEYANGAVKKGSVPADARSVVIAPAHDGVLTSEIGLNGFRDMAALASAHIPYTVQKIANNGFYRCGLTDVALPMYLQHIGAEAFYGCNHLKSVRLPASAAWIGYQAFFACESLQYVMFRGSTLPEATTLSFSHTAALLVPETALDAFKGKFYGMAGQILSHEALSGDFITAGAKLVKYTGASETVALPDGVTGIAAYAFYGNTAVKRVEIPAAVATVEDYAFANMADGLTLSVAFAEGGAPAGWGAKWNCDSGAKEYEVRFA